MSERLCGVEGCDGQHYAKGRCKEHYEKRLAYEELSAKPLKSDSLRIPSFTLGQEANLCSLIRALPTRKP